MNTETFSADDFLNRSVKDMRPDEQPREKLMKYGADSLSDAELLAILLRTGTKKLNVIETSRALLDHFGGLHQLFRKEWNELGVMSMSCHACATHSQHPLELCQNLLLRLLRRQCRWLWVAISDCAETELLSSLVCVRVVARVNALLV